MKRERFIADGRKKRRKVQEKMGMGDMAATDHSTRVEHDERYLARPFGIFCCCGWKACTNSESEAKRQEAERVKENHERSRGSENS
jgi:hypothetical protein